MRDARTNEAITPGHTRSHLNQEPKSSEKPGSGVIPSPCKVKGPFATIENAGRCQQHLCHLGDRARFPPAGPVLSHRYTWLELLRAPAGTGCPPAGAEEPAREQVHCRLSLSQKPGKVAR